MRAEHTNHNTEVDRNQLLMCLELATITETYGNGIDTAVRGVLRVI